MMVGMLLNRQISQNLKRQHNLSAGCLTLPGISSNFYGKDNIVGKLHWLETPYDSFWETSSGK